MTGSHSNDTTLRADGPDAARDPHGEPLSAMMDGTLSDDESRFLLRRMQHDAELAGRWERWQSYGDAMRGSAGRALPADFHRRIALAVAAEGQGADGLEDREQIMLDAVAGEPRGGYSRGHMAPMQQPAAATARRPLLRWGGGAALAASVAFAAIVGLRPATSVLPGTPSPTPGAALVDAAPAGAAAGNAAQPIAAPTPASAVGGSSPDTAMAAASSGTTGSAPEQSLETRAPAASVLASTPSHAVERAPRPMQADAGDARSANAASTLVAEESIEATAAPRVPELRAGFTGDAADDDLPLIAKPWPRSPLLQGRMDGGVMVDYGEGGDGRGLILGRPAQAPRSGSTLLSPSFFGPASGGPASAAQPAGDSAGAGPDQSPGRRDATPR